MATLTASPPTATRSRHGLALAALAFAQFIIVFNGTSANLALPDVTANLHLGEGLSVWFVAGYLLSFGGLLLLAGRLGDIVGRRRLFLFAITVFGIGATAAGLAPNGGVLIAARLLQGVGAAGIGPMVLSLIVATFPDPDARRRAIGVWGAVASAGGGLGVLGGGALTSWLGWRAVLLLNTPVAILLLIAVPLAVARVPRQRDVHTGAGGAVLSVLGIGALIAGLTTGGSNGWLAASTLILLGAGLILLILFGVTERYAAHPFIPWHLLSRWPAVGGDIAMLAGSCAMYPAMLIASVLLQTEVGLSPLVAGLMLLPTSAATVAAALMTPRIVARLGAIAPVMIGLGATVVGVGAFAAVAAAGTPLGGFLPAMIIFGAGLGLTITGSTGLALSGAAPAETGAASGLLQTGQQLGGAISITIITTIAAAIAHGTGSSDMGYGVGLAVAAAVALTGLIVVASRRLR